VNIKERKIKKISEMLKESRANSFTSPSGVVEVRSLPE
jgi:hypothetical protein